MKAREVSRAVPRRGMFVLCVPLLLAAMTAPHDATAESSESEPPARAPSLLLVIVDTLRWDRVGASRAPGMSDTATPSLDRLLAERGAVVPETRAPAPWTLPSMISLLSGRPPGELLSEDARTFAIPEQAPTLAEVVRSLGYRTAAFYANPTLDESAGFGRGFDTVWVAQTAAALQRHAEDELQPRARAWLAAHQHEPFFALVHYLDPHDPYESPDALPDERPRYRGRLTGGSVHGLYTGALALDDPEADVRHLEALYDSEVRYVDRMVADLLTALDPAVLANTLVVLTADHGEEIHDHGGWKHGQALYEEQIRVPLLLRWDRGIPAGRRLDGPASLLDVAPTLVAAAGGRPPREWSGIDLLPFLRSGEELPARASFAQHLSSGPLRAAVVVGASKVVLFDRRRPFAPPDELHGALWQRDLARFERVELYDLERDPGERTNLAPTDPARVAALAPEIHRRLERHLHGLRVMAAGVPAGATLRARLVLSRAPTGWRSHFLADGDRVALEGRRLELELGGDAIEKGLLVDGDDKIAVERAAVWLDGTPLPRTAVALGPRRARPPVGRSDLTASGWPASPGAPQLRVWRPSREGPGPRLDPSEETTSRLRALGYLQ